MSKDRTRYTEVHVGLWDNRKFRRLVRILGVEETTLVGILVSFWHSTQHQADVESGRLLKWDLIDIAEAARWKGDPQKFVDAMLAERWIHKDIDGSYRMHEWEFYGGSGWTKKKDAAERTAASRMGLSVADYREVKRKQAESAPEQLVLEQRDNGHSSRGVTVTGGVGNSHNGEKSRDVTRDPIRSDPVRHDPVRHDPVRHDPVREDSGDANGDNGTNSHNHEPAGQETRSVDRGRQNPMPTKPHAAHVGARLNGAGVGFMENPANFPQSPEALLAKHPELEPHFPQLDGRAPRPTLLDAIRAHWSWYLTNRDRPNGGHLHALATLKLDLAKDAKTHDYSWKQDGAQTNAPKVRNKDAYEECLLLAEKAHTDCPPNPDEQHGEWLTWCSTHQDLVKRAKKNVTSRGTKAAAS